MRRVREVGAHILTSRHPVDRILRQAALLDGAGFDHVKVGDHTLVTNSSANYPNAQVVLAAIGARTNRVRLSTAVTDPYRRHPVEIAHWIATLDQLTGGRAVLGIGAGEVMNIVPYGMEMKRPFTRLREAVEVIKRLWEATPSSPADYSGEVFRLEGAYIQARVVQRPRPPIYIGAIRKKTRELTGQVADGWIAMSSESPESLKEQLQDVESAARGAGRKVEDLDIVVTAYTDIGEDRERTYKSVESAAKGALVWEREMLEKTVGLQVPEELSVQKMDVTDERALRRMEEFSARIPRKLVEEITLIGSADECIARIEKFLDAGATSLIICNLGPEQERVFELYAKRIFPYLRENYGTGGRRR